MDDKPEANRVLHSPARPDAWTIEPGSRAISSGLRATILLGAEGAALAFFVACLVLGTRLPLMIQENGLASGDRNAILIAVLLAAVLPVAGIATHALRFPAEAGKIAETLSRLALPVLPLAAYPLLLVAPVWFSRPLNYLLLLSGFVLLLERCLDSAFAALPARFATRLVAATRMESVKIKRISLILVVCGASAYALYTGYLTILNHYRFGTGAYDLAIYDNLMFNALDGNPFRSTVLFGDRGGNSLSTHSEYGMVLFLPFYALYPSAETLLALQALLFGLAAVPLYLFALTQLPRWQALVLAGAYLLYAPLHGAQFYDFHWLPLTTFFQFLLYWSIARYKNWVTLFAVLVLFSLREDVAPGIALVGLYLMIGGGRARLGALLAVSSSVWFALNKFVIMPALGSWWFDQLYKGLIAPGEQGWGSIIRTMLTNPLFVLTTVFTQPKLEYALHLLAPLAFLPIRKPRLLWLLLPGFLFTLMTTDYYATTSIAFQYTTHWIPYLFAAVVIVLRALNEIAERRAAAALLALVFAVTSHTAIYGVVIAPSSFVGGILPIHFSLTDEEREHLNKVERLISMIPPRASVTSTDFEAPHLSNRPDLFAIGQDLSAGEYFLIDVERFKLGATRNNVHTLLRTKPYGLVAQDGTRLYLFRQGEKSADTEQAIAELMRR